ncbi:glycosyltransferase involved in cell wall biosynthesis [Scopulibacillus darangshiensis]|uniref:Glycosyltransferase involved in cell wall biosynthesis n=1 Tax=Scopulibacillus darangshiensis TaxID=442528 RepID=A0A4R2NVI1_9BACL|nr:glycosyltransferase family 4 protein [Scopulibacillus darangshiensis]TCP26010.1 glycosyltransferase involved in cell wall biosynthesis [Scopulibacillus darangshiensis]
MKILLTTIFAYPHTGGLSTHMSTLKSGLEAEGHQVGILSFNDVPRLKGILRAQGPAFFLNKFKKGKGFVWSQLQRKQLIHNLLKGLDESYDIINAQDIFAALASVGLGLPTALTSHGYMAYEAISKGALASGSKEDQLIRNMERHAYQHADRVITVDQRIKGYILEASGVEATAIKNFINVDDFKPDKTKKVLYKKELGLPKQSKILFVPRRLTKKNGVVFPALALPRILKEEPHTLLLYAGTGEDLPDIKRIIKQKGIEKNVVLLGAVPHYDMKKYYAVTDVVLIPSIHSEGVEEATSIAALEAMGSGAPVVASFVGGLKEIIENGKDGIHVEEQNPEALSQAVLNLLNHPAYANNLAEKARGKIEENHSHIAAAKRYADIYRG